MSFTITSRKFYDEFTGVGGGGSDTLNGCQGDYIMCVIEGYFKWYLEGLRLTFDSATKTITMANALDYSSFIVAEFKAGDSIAITGTDSNDGNYTIVSVSERVITVTESLVNETAEETNVYGTTPITAMDFYYNLIRAGNSEAYQSAVDKGTLQRYTVSGLDASVTTPVYMIVGTDSYGWVPDIVSGETSGVTVEGVEIIDYKQKFKITQAFYQAPLWTNEIIPNFLTKKAPDDFTNGNHLMHVCKVDGKFEYCSAEVAHTGSSIGLNDRGCWFNQNNAGSRPEYSLVGISYTDDETGEPVEKIDANRKTNVIIIINSRSGKFTTSGSGGTKYKLSHFLCPLNEGDYTDTLTTMPQNLRIDSKITIQGLGPANGDQFDTDYQSLTDIQFVQDSVNQVTCTFSVEYSDAIKTYLRNLEGNRYYSFIISTQDKAITTTTCTDRVNIICDFQSSDFDPTNADLFGLKDYFHGFSFPNEVTNDQNNVSGYEGDYFYEVIPFWVETALVAGVTPTLDQLSLQVVSTKEGEDDFVLEEKKFDTSTIRKLLNVQSIDIDNDRNFILPVGSVWNRCTLKRVPENDNGTKAYYEVRYGFVLRYEAWRQVVQSALGAQYAIFNDVEDVVHAWERYSQGNGWELKFRMNASVKGYDGFVTEFQSQTSVVVLNRTDAPPSGVNFATDLKFYDERGNEVPGVLDNQLTRIVATFMGDVESFPEGFDSHYGYIFSDTLDSGGIFSRRFASTEKDSETDSPFSSVELPVNSEENSNRYSNNLRLSIFSNRIELDCWYDGAGNKGNVVIYPRLGFLGNQRALGFSDRTPIYLANGNGIALN